MFISQEKAKLILRKEAGFSVAKSKTETASLPKTKDGKRDKVRLADVQRIVAQANKPTTIADYPNAVPIRPFRKDLRARIRKENGFAVLD